MTPRKGLRIDVKQYPMEFKDILESFFEGFQLNVAGQVCDILRSAVEIDTERLFKLLRERGLSCSDSTIYKTLQKLDRVGIIEYKRRYGAVKFSFRFRNILRRYIEIYDEYFMVDEMKQE